MLKFSTFFLVLVGFIPFVNGQEIPIAGYHIDVNNRAVISFDAKPDNYYLLQVKNLDSKTFSHFTTMAYGSNGRISLREPLGALPLANYKVWEVPTAAPLDIDADGINDLVELADPINKGPFNAAKTVAFQDGVVSIPNRQVFKTLSYNGTEIAGIDPHLKDLMFVKFFILGNTYETAKIYFINSETHKTHNTFKQATKINSFSGFGEVLQEIRGEIVYHPDVQAANGTLGVYRFEFEPMDSYSFAIVQLSFDLIAANMPFLNNNLSYFPMPIAALPVYELEKKLYDNSRIPILFENDIYGNIDFMALNQAEGYGLLTMADFNSTPGGRDIVIYEHLPNEMPRTGGIISLETQTPLSHVNLRAIQDNVPNAFIRNADKAPNIASLIGKYVHYVVKQTGYEIREATLAEVNDWYRAIRPIEEQLPPLNLTYKRILDLDQIGFEMSDGFGVKCANLAEMRNFGFESDLIPDGYGIPFYYYREFMAFNGLFDKIRSIITQPKFLSDVSTRESELKAIRKMIEKASMPDWMLLDLKAMQDQFPKGVPIRCRSSTNNEDLPHFSGAGLYDSKTHRPDEGHIAKTIKEVFASLWNFRAFEERDFYRVNHFQASMGVLCHPNQDDEILNGVGISIDPFYYTENAFYLNNQIGEDLVTNPNAFSIPEEILVDVLSKSKDHYRVVKFSNLSDQKLIIAPAHLASLRDRLIVIHNRFKKLYHAEESDDFGIEIEYKVTADNKLLIKQARPWLGPVTNAYSGFFPEPNDIKNDIQIKLIVYPNPVEWQMQIDYDIPDDGNVNIELISSSGEVLYSQLLGYKLAGRHVEPMTLSSNFPNQVLLILRLELNSKVVRKTANFKILKQ